MPVFVQLVGFQGKTSRKDADTINSVLLELQQSGAKIIDIKPSLASGIGGLDSTYLITYEASSPIKVRL